MTLLDEFVISFGVWDEVRPCLYLMVDEQEMQLVVSLCDKLVAVDDAAGLLGITRKRAGDLLLRCYARCIVDKTVEDGITTHSVGTFHAFLDYFAKFENWDDIPADDRSAIDRRFLDEFVAKHRPNVERKMQGLEAENALPNDTVLLLSEAEEMLHAARHIVV